MTQTGVTSNMALFLFFVKGNQRTFLGRSVFWLENDFDISVFQRYNTYDRFDSALFLDKFNVNSGIFIRISECKTQFKRFFFFCAVSDNILEDAH